MLSLLLSNPPLTKTIAMTNATYDLSVLDFFLELDGYWVYLRKCRNPNMSLSTRPLAMLFHFFFSFRFVIVPMPRAAAMVTTTSYTRH